MVTLSSDPWNQIPFRNGPLSGDVIYLADPTLEVIRRWGLADRTMGLDCARPAAFILDEAGVIRWRHFPDNWRQRMNAEDYLDALGRAGGLTVPQVGSPEGRR